MITVIRFIAAFAWMIFALAVIEAAFQFHFVAGVACWAIGFAIVIIILPIRRSSTKQGLQEDGPR